VHVIHFKTRIFPLWTSANQGDYGNGLKLPQLIANGNTRHHSTTISWVKSQRDICDHEASSDSQFTIAFHNQFTIFCSVYHLLRAEMVLPSSTMSSSPSCGFSPSVSQVWSPTLSSPDCGPLSEFRDWDPSSQISQFVNDLNYVPTGADLAPVNVLGSHEKEDTKGGNYGEQCKLDEDSLAFQEVSMQPLDTGVCVI